MSVIGDVPARTPIKGLITEVWRGWLQAVKNKLNASPEALGAVPLTGQGAAIGITSIPTAPVGRALAEGSYRVTYTARVTTPAGVSSALTVTIGWTDGGVACSQSGAVMNGNTTATVQSGTVIVHIDKGTAVTYSTTYASNAAGVMRYALQVALESLPGL